MPYALVIIAKNPTSSAWPDEMHRALHRIPSTEEAQRLNESAWLLNLDSSLLFLARIIAIAHDAKLPHHVLFFDERPRFVATQTTADE